MDSDADESSLSKDFVIFCDSLVSPAEVFSGVEELVLSVTLSVLVVFFMSSSSLLPLVIVIGLEVLLGKLWEGRKEKEEEEEEELLFATPWG